MEKDIVEKNAGSKQSKKSHSRLPYERDDDYCEKRPKRCNKSVNTKRTENARKVRIERAKKKRQLN